MNPHAGVVQPEAVESDYQMQDCLIVLEMREPLAGKALRSWSFDCISNISCLIQKDCQKKNVFSIVSFEILQFLERKIFMTNFSKTLGIQI
jgi:hypothetical protein